jgi:hypothetical protein
MGQGGVGKTALTMRFCYNEFPTDYMPTIGDMFTKDVEVLGQPRHVEIDDTAGQVRPGHPPSAPPLPPIRGEADSKPPSPAPLSPPSLLRSSVARRRRTQT